MTPVTENSLGTVRLAKMCLAFGGACTSSVVSNFLSTCGVIAQHSLLLYITLTILLLLLIISVTHSTCGVLCTVVGGVCAAASKF